MKKKFIALIIFFMLLITISLFLILKNYEVQEKEIFDDGFKYGIDSSGNLYSESSEGKIIYGDNIQIIKEVENGS